MDGDMAAGQGHPYFPQDAVIPGYAPNSSPLPVILGSFGGIIGAFVLACVTLATWYSPALKRADQLTVAWFALCELTIMSLPPAEIPLTQPVHGARRLPPPLLRKYLPPAIPPFS
jgi:hypothetical protein